MVYTTSMANVLPSKRASKFKSYDQATEKNISLEQRRRKSRKIVIGVLAAVIMGILLFGLFLYLPQIVQTSETVYVEKIPFVDDFHLSKGFFQTSRVTYYFNITPSAGLWIDVVSDEPINLILVNNFTKNIKIERKYSQVISETVVLKRGIWFICIIPSNFRANGRIELKKWTPAPIYRYVHIDAERKDSEIIVSYKDDLNETVSVFISIEAHDLVDGLGYVEVWNCTVKGKSNFSKSWIGREDTSYIVSVVAEHNTFGEIKFSEAVPSLPS